MFGAGNEPTAEQFTAMFPADSYQYNPGEIISSRTEAITAGAETITTGFQELHSAREAHDYIDMNGGKIRRINQKNNTTLPGLCVWSNGIISIKSENITSAADLSGAVLHYELATPTNEPVTIPEPLQEWLPVEPGGTVTFQNSDDTKHLPVPNAVSWVRKLNEVE